MPNLLAKVNNGLGARRAFLCGQLRSVPMKLAASWLTQHPTGRPIGSRLPSEQPASRMKPRDRKAKASAFGAMPLRGSHFLEEDDTTRYLPALVTMRSRPPRRF